MVMFQTTIYMERGRDIYTEVYRRISFVPGNGVVPKKEVPTKHTPLLDRHPFREKHPVTENRATVRRGCGFCAQIFDP